MGAKPDEWILIKNRGEKLVVDTALDGVKCDWLHTSDISIVDQLSGLGGAVAKKAFSRWAINSSADSVEAHEDGVEVSFIIGHRGLERLPHLLSTLQCIGGQTGVSVECIVVEQSVNQEVNLNLPEWVTYIHVPLESFETGYCRSLSFNIGARHSKGKLLILHDNDMLVPSGYAQEHLEIMSMGYEVINLKRFIFYPTEKATNLYFENHDLDACLKSSSKIKQNATGGGSVAIVRQCYFSIGGFDEGFVGWGGEDDEFWDRAKTRKVYDFNYIPIVHLWHRVQPEKRHRKDKGVALLDTLRKITVDERMARLVATNFEHCVADRH